jgi:hypothetical protein
MLFCFTACDRFDNTFTPRQTAEEFVNEFEGVATDYLKAGNINSLMSFYEDDYLNNGVTKDSIQTFYSTYEWTENAKINMERINSLSYTFSVIDTTISVDKSWVDYIGFIGKQCRWVGNGLMDSTEPPEPPETVKQIVLAQSLTYITCQYCPYAKRELKRLEEIYEGNFVFLAYDSRPREPFGFYNAFNEERTYWDNPEEPFVLFQGRRAESGANPATLNRYKDNIDYFRDQDAEIELNNLQFTVNGLQISGAVELNYSQLNEENLYLFYVVYEDHTTVNYQTSVEGEIINFGNVVIGRGKHLLEELYDGKEVGFELVSQTDLDTDTYLVVWVQRIENLNRIGTNDKVLNAVKSPLY